MKAINANDKERLHEEWHRHPKVRELNQAALTHARIKQLKYTPDGITQTNQFINTWIAENGPLPDSRILCN